MACSLTCKQNNDDIFVQRSLLHEQNNDDEFVLLVGNELVLIELDKQFVFLVGDQFLLIELDKLVSQVGVFKIKLQVGVFRVCDDCVVVEKPSYNPIFGFFF